MKCKYFLGFALALLSLPGSLEAQSPTVLKYTFQTGQVWRFQSVQTVRIESTVSGTKQEFSSQTRALREWKVQNVDAQGNAQLTVTIVEAQVQAQMPDGKKIEFDTEDNSKPTPLDEVVGRPLAEIQLSPSGQILNLRQSGSTAAGPFLAHLRTLIYPLPDRPIGVGASWQQELPLPLPPPLGTGEQVMLRQTLQLEKVEGGIATINLRTTPAEEMKDKQLLARIAQFMPSGRIEFDVTRGLVRNQELILDHVVNEFAGAESTMVVSGTHHEKLVETSMARRP